MEDKGLQAIKERLAPVSKEQWVAQLGDPLEWEPSSVHLESRKMVADRLSAEQAQFIAQAPQDMADLIAEVERLRKENTDLSQIALHDTHDEFVAVREIKKLREALEFYANHGTYLRKMQGMFESSPSDIEEDEGQIARKALEGEKL